MAAKPDELFWAFIMYVKNNPHKSIDNMNETDFDEMVRQFAAVNATAGLTVATAPDAANSYGYGTVDLTGVSGTPPTFPKKGTAGLHWAANGLGIAVAATYLLSMALVKQAQYPEDHRGE